MDVMIGIAGVWTGIVGASVILTASNNASKIVAPTLAVKAVRIITGTALLVTAVAVLKTL